MPNDSKIPAPLPTHSAEQASDPVPAGSGTVVVNLGKKRSKDIRKLRKGSPGKLLTRVEEVMEHLRQNGALTGEAQPIVFVVEKRPKRIKIAKRWGLG